MKFEEYINCKIDDIIALCKKYHVKKLEIFGSATNETFNPNLSDVDFLVEFMTNELGPWMSIYFNFKEDLEKLIGKPIDLIMTKALKNRYFISEVNKTRKKIYAD